MRKTYNRLNYPYRWKFIEYYYDESFHCKKIIYGIELEKTALWGFKRIRDVYNFYIEYLIRGHDEKSRD